MRLAKLTVILICALFLSGCFNYRDINRLFFATTVVIDIDAFDNPVSYIECFKSYRGSAQESGTEIKVVFRGIGKTLYDSYINATLSASNEIDVSQIKALIFTEKAAREGLDKFIDIFERDQKPTVRMFMFVLTGNPESFMDTKVADEKYLGLFLQDLMSTQERLGKMYSMRLNEFLNKRLLGSTVTAIPIVILSHNQPGRIEIQGAAVIQKDKMVSKLTPDELIPYNHVMHTGTYGVLLADNPNQMSERIALKVLRSRTKISVDYINDKVIVNKKIRATATMVESQRSSFVLNDSVRKEIENSASDNLKRKCIKLFEDYKEQGIDIYNITRDFEEKYPNVKIDDILEKAILGTTDIKVHLEGSNNSTDFK